MTSVLLPHSVLTNGSSLHRQRPFNTPDVPYRSGLFCSWSCANDDERVDLDHSSNPKVFLVDQYIYSRYRGYRAV